MPMLCRVLASRPSAARLLGSMPMACRALLSRPALAAGAAVGAAFVSSPKAFGSIPIAWRVLASMPSAANIIGSSLPGFLGSPIPNIAAVIGSNFFGSKPYRAARDIGFLGSSEVSDDMGFLGSNPRLAMVLRPDVL